MWPVALREPVLRNSPRLPETPPDPGFSTLVDVLLDLRQIPDGAGETVLDSVEAAGIRSTPRVTSSNAILSNKAFSWIARDWQLGTLLRYGSGTPIASPTSPNSLATYLFQSTLFSRVPGVPLFTHDLNCHCFDPNTTFVLNPAAWSNPGPD